MGGLMNSSGRSGQEIVKGFGGRVRIDMNLEVAVSDIDKTGCQSGCALPIANR
jgi:hypothetical protein